MSSRKITNEQTRQVEEFLRSRGFPDVECYQREGYDFLMRLRVTDPRFRGLNRVDRAALVEEELAKLPDDLQASISMLVLVTPEERKTSLHSLEFDDPSRVLL